MPKYSIPFNAAEMPNYSFGMAKRADGDKNTKSEGEKFKASFFTWLFALNVLYFGVLVIRWNYFLSRFVLRTYTTIEITSNILVKVMMGDFGFPGYFENPLNNTCLVGS